MSSKEEKLAFILSHGWEKYGSSSYVKTEWLHDPRGHLSPNWYRSESLDSAYDIETGVRKIDKEKEDYILLHGWEAHEDGYVKSNWIDKNNPLNVEDAYLAAMFELNNAGR